MYITGRPKIALERGAIEARAGIIAIFMSLALMGDRLVTGSCLNELVLDTGILLIAKACVCAISAAMTHTRIIVLLELLIAVSEVDELSGGTSCP